MWFLLFYLVCAVLAYGVALNNFTKEFPYMSHRGACFCLAFLGPLSLIVAALFSFASIGEVGLRFRHLSYEERKEIFLTMYPSLDEEYFDENHKGWLD